MDFLLSLPYLVKILLSLVIILLVNSIIKRLWAALLIGALILGFWAGHGPSEVARIAWIRFFSFDNLMLLLVVFLVIWLSSLMSKTGLMERLVGLVNSLLKPRSAMAVLPAIIGLLPMPGGALFSAPMVENSKGSETAPALIKTKVNYWFRHIWEFWWPLYPGVILSMAISGLDFGTFVIHQFPLTLISLAAGIFFILSKVPRPKSENLETEQGYPAKQNDKIVDTGAWELFIPFLFIIGLYLVIRFFVPELFEYSKYLPMAAGVIAALIYTGIRYPLPLKTWMELLFSKKTLVLAAIVAAVRVYSAFIEMRVPGGIFLLDAVREELITFGIPTLSLIIVLPFVSGLTTGLAIGFVGASFPVVFSLASGIESGIGSTASVLVLAFASGYAGMLLSPVHVCLIVTNEFFKTQLVQSIRSLLIPASILVFGGYILYLLY
ncbi:MAG: DUF401 family protein [Spirochaetales bacterium]|nr:DUF401 family protein [Spirochaetales bacterium]